jgi:hypothetical protein
VIYYILCHITSCIWISIGLWKADVRDGWIRRLPAPQLNGMRQSPVLDDVSQGSLYIHALWFVVNTVSHVAVGDVSAVNN